MAWDNPKEDLEAKFRWWAKNYRRTSHKATVFVLTNYDSTFEENMYRIKIIRDCGLQPYVTIYDKPHAPREVIKLQQWCNNRLAFNTVEYEDFVPNLAYYEQQERKKKQGDYQIEQLSLF